MKKLIFFLLICLFVTSCDWDDYIFGHDDQPYSSMSYYNSDSTSNNKPYGSNSYNNSDSTSNNQRKLKSTYKPEELEEFFEVAKNLNTSSSHNLKLVDVSSSDFDKIAKIINKNDDFYLNLTIISTFNLKIPSNAFGYSNSSIRSLVLDSYVSEISSSAFKRLTALKEVTINSQVKTIGDEAFKNCSSLKEVYLKCPPPVLKSKNCFSSTSSQLNIYVSNKYYNSYLEADYWKDLKIKKSY